MSELTNMLARRHFDRGHQFELQDQMEQAVEAYEAAVALEPDFHDPYFLLARIEASRGAYERALELLDDACERCDDVQIIEWRAYVLGRLRRYDEALSDYRRVLDEGDPQVRVNVGRMLLALHRYDEAEDVLSQSEEPSGRILCAALPRYREYGEVERTDDGRAVRYLFGRTLVLGTAGEESRALAAARYLLLTPRHIAVSVVRFLAFVDARGWRFDAVAGEGPHHGPVAATLAELLGLPHASEPAAGSRVLLCSAVVRGIDEAVALRRPLKDAGHRVLHLALGFVPEGDPGEGEPEVVGFVNRCAVPWYRVEDFARLMPDPDEELTDENPFPGFKVGPAYVDPNTSRVAEELLVACRDAPDDPLLEEVVAYFSERHPSSRAFEWEG